MNTPLLLLFMLFAFPAYAMEYNTGAIALSLLDRCKNLEPILTNRITMIDARLTNICRVFGYTDLVIDAENAMDFKAAHNVLTSCKKKYESDLNIVNDIRRSHGRHKQFDDAEQAALEQQYAQLLINANPELDARITAELLGEQPITSLQLAELSKYACPILKNYNEK